MPQYLRPDSNVTQTSYTGGFAEIDEETANDSDLAFGLANSSVPVLEVGLTDPPEIPSKGGSFIVRWRSAKRSEGGSINTGNSFNATCSLYQGGSLLGSDTYSTGNWADREFSIASTSITDPNDLRIRFNQTASGGNNSNQRSGLAVSWAEVEAPASEQVIVIT